MNLLLLHDADFLNASRVSLRGRRFEHAVQVLKANVGESFAVGLLGGKLGQGTVVELGSDFVTLDVTLDREPPSPSHIQLLMGLPRPKSLLRLINLATQLGIKRIDFTHSYRVEKSYWHCEQLQPKRLRAAWIKGLEQARDTIPPELHFHRRLKPFVEDELPKLVGSRTAIVAHPYADSHVSAKSTSDTVLALGPEGGFIDYEIKMLNAIGFRSLKFGERILSLENALPHIVGALT